MKLLPLAAVAVLTGPPAFGQNPGGAGLDWVAIGDPGNRATLPSEAPFHPDPMGAVNYEFHITRTPVTATQWLEFVEAYAPYLDSQTQRSLPFTTLLIQRTAPGPDPRYGIIPGKEHHPVDPSWHFAATYCNWLHNGKAAEKWAFESGTYDISTFYKRPDGSRADQRERSPGAQYYLPNLDEWTKAVYYDPDRYGAGEEGYWPYPGGSEDPLVSGLPGVPGAETSAGTGELLPVGQYPGVDAPWGLLDASGGRFEWIEDVYREDGKYRRNVSSSRFSDPWYEDRIDTRFFHRSPDLSGVSFRVATTIPAPPAMVTVAAFSLFSWRRRR